MVAVTPRPIPAARPAEDATGRRDQPERPAEEWSIAAETLPPHETWSADERRAAQAARLTAGLPDVLAGNPFYRAKLAAAGIRDAREITGSWAAVPFDEDRALRHQAAHQPGRTSRTRSPVRALSPDERHHRRLHPRHRGVLGLVDGGWADIYRAAGVTAADRVFFCFRSARSWALRRSPARLSALASSAARSHAGRVHRPRDRGTVSCNRRTRPPRRGRARRGRGPARSSLRVSSTPASLGR